MKRSRLLLVSVLTLVLMIVASCTVSNHTHAFDTWEMVMVPTETTEGRAAKKCSCGSISSESVVLPVLTDEEFWEKEVVEATCTAEGSATYTSAYGEVVVVIEKIEHTFDAWKLVVEPTATEKGEAVKVCSCGEEEANKEVVAELADETVWEKETVEATCTTEGSETYKSVYGTIVVVLPIEEHVYGDWTITVEPTETEAGHAEKVCVCTDTVEATVPALSDESVWTLVEHEVQDCTKEGSKTYTSIYGTVVVVIEKDEHVYENWTMTVEPTETEVGTITGTCKCEDTKEKELAVLTDESVWTLKDSKAADYNEAGYRTYESVYGEVTVVVAKKVAPYDGKTYSTFCFDADNDMAGFEYRQVGVETAWNDATITFDANGQGVGSGFPFRGFVTITMVNEATGQIEISIQRIEYDSDNNPVLDEAGNVIFVEGDVTKNTGFVDFETGIIVSAYNSNLAKCHVWTPYEVNVDGTKANASAWDNSMAIEYTHEENTHRIYVTKDMVYFGVSFLDANKDQIVAENCYNAPIVTITDAAGKVINTFVYNGEEAVVADGFQGTYTKEEVTLVVTGHGVLTYNGTQGTYTKAEGTHSIDAYVNGEFLEFTLTENTYEVVKPMVAITFVAGEYGTMENISVNKNIPVALANPTVTSNQYVFKGWYYDQACTNEVAAEFIPTEDVVLYAKWQAKVEFVLVGVVDGDADVVYLGEGDILGDYLPVYGVVADKVFKGWFLDEEYSESAPLDYEVSAEDTGFTFYAKWEDLPAYYGSYKGANTYGESSTSSVGKTMSIDENGVITGLRTGTIEEYNVETGVITYKTNPSDTAVKYMYFDAATHTIAMAYSASGVEIGTDLYFMIKDSETGTPNAHFAISSPKTIDATGSFGNYARFVNVTVDGVAKDVLVWTNRIYSNIVVTDTLGNPLTTTTIKDSKTVVVKDATTGAIILALASTGANYDDKNTSVALDPYFGEYTNGEEVVNLDGTGVIVCGEKTGTYAKASEGKAYGFDVYLENNTEYYQLTLDGSTFVMNKVMATITYVTGEGHNVVEAQQFNINVVATLPVLEEVNYVFNGWFFDAEFTQAVPASFIPTEDDTLYAKFSAPAELTIVFNNGAENEVRIYSVGDIVTVDMPVYAKHAFAGWYTTETFEEGTEWTSGAAISVDTVIYAKWEVAPIYNNTYVPTQIEGTNANGGTSSLYTRTSAIANVDPYGKAAASGYPFGSAIEIKNFDADTNTLEFWVGTSVYQGFIDPVSGIIILNYAKGLDTDIAQVFMLTPFETGSLASNGRLSSSYWNGGKSRAIQYTFEETTYSIFVFDNQVYFGVTFEDGEGNAVAGNACYNASTLYVKDVNGDLIAKFAYDGTTMQALDGNEGTYTFGESTLVVNGVNKVVYDSVEGTYTKAQDGATYSIDVYVNNVYHEITLDKENMTFTVNTPFVTVTFDAGEQALVDAVSTNKNIAITLPTPTNPAYIFRGWYSDAEFENSVDDNYIPTQDVTLYAKWDALVTLTVVYGNGMEDEVLYYGAGDTATPAEPNFTNGLVFNGWYTDEDCTVSYTVGAITENTVIYCGWKEAVAQFGSYKGFEVWGSSAAGSTTSGGSSSKSLEIDASGNVTGAHTGTITEYNPETGVFKLVSGTSYRWGFFDVENGILAYAYSTNKETLGNDVYIYIRGVENAVTGSTLASYWNAGLSRLMTVTLTGHEKESVNLFLHEDIIHWDVTFEATGVENLAAKDAYKQEDLRVYASNGELIAEFMKKDGKLQIKALDGYEGTYTVGEDTMVLDGYGKGTYNGVAISYSVSANVFTVIGEGVSKVLSYAEATNTFTVLELDAFANKTLKAQNPCPNYSWSDTHTVSFAFDGKGNVTISCVCTDMSWCGAPSSVSGAGTYVIDGDTMTVTKGSYTVVFSISGTTLTVTSTNIASDDGAYLPTGTTVK